MGPVRHAGCRRDCACPICCRPPSAGAVIDAIAQAAPKRVVYVSCNVATQARDAALFVEKGYKVQKVQSVDMFCWTSGVENVMVLAKL